METYIHLNWAIIFYGFIIGPYSIVFVTILYIEVDHVITQRWMIQPSIFSVVGHYIRAIRHHTIYLHSSPLIFFDLLVKGVQDLSVCCFSKSIWLSNSHIDKCNLIFQFAQSSWNLDESNCVSLLWQVIFADWKGRLLTYTQRISLALKWRMVLPLPA